MSFIRSTSNPEKLYIVAESTFNGRRIVIFEGSAGSKKTKTLPYYVFEGVFLNWWKNGTNDTKFKGASLTETKDFKWRLSYTEWSRYDYIDMYEVTACYLLEEIKRRL